MNIGDRLSNALLLKNVKAKDIVNKFNITQQQVSNIKKADKLNDTIANIAAGYCINLNWLLLGEGEMFTDKSRGNEKNAHDIPFLFNKNNSLSIPMLISQNESSSLVAFTQDNMIYIINTGVNKYIKKANYLLEKNEIYYIRNIDMTLDNNFEICEINNHDSKGHTFSLEELQKFKIVGMVEYSLKVEVQRVS